jgi:hypothetical protein
MDAAGTLVPSTKLHSVTFHKTVILTLPEDLSSHVLNSFLSKGRQNLRRHWDQHLCHYIYLQTTLELTEWIIYVGIRLTAEVALQVRTLYFFYFVSMIHKMAASYTRNVFKVNEVPLIISAAPIISLYKTMCWGTDHVTKLASPLLQRVPFNQTRNFIYWEKPITTLNVSCNSLIQKETGLASNLDVPEQKETFLRHADSSRMEIFVVVGSAFFSVHGPPHTWLCASAYWEVRWYSYFSCPDLRSQWSGQQYHFVFGMTRFQTSAQRPLYWLRPIKISLTFSPEILWQYLKLGRNHFHQLTVRFTVYWPSCYSGLYGVSYGQGR